MGSLSQWPPYQSLAGELGDDLEPQDLGNLRNTQRHQQMQVLVKSSLELEGDPGLGFGDLRIFPSRPSFGQTSRKAMRSQTRREQSWRSHCVFVPEVALGALQLELFAWNPCVVLSGFFFSCFWHVYDHDHGVLLWKINCVPREWDLPNLGAEVSGGHDRCTRFIRTP